MTIGDTMLKTLLDLFYVCFLCLKSFVLCLTPKKWRHKSIVGQNVLITGAGTGLGRALAIRFAKYGTNIALLDLDERSVKLTEKLLLKHFKGFYKSYVCDVADRQMVNKTMEEVNKDMGFVSVLVNNAGVLYGKPILEMTDDNIINTLNVNTLSNFWTIRAVLPEMLSANKGQIVTISSLCAKIPFVQMTAYCASKNAVLGLNECLRYELLMRPDNKIVTTTVLPTFFRTDFIRGATPTQMIRFEDPERVADRIMDAVLTDEELVVFPAYLNILVVIQAMIPVQAMNLIYKMIGGFEVMKEFRGRSVH